MNLFDVNTVMFTFLGYAMSPIEFFGTLLNIACVWLAYRNKILSWPIGLVSTLLFGALFYQIALYSDTIEQGYFLVTGIYGWIVWARMGKPKDAAQGVRWSSPRGIALTSVVVASGTISLGAFMSDVHVLIPAIFPTPAAFPFLDAFTTAMSFVANFLLAKRRVENWILWIIVDVIGIGLYAVKGVLFVALLYVIFLVLATMGLVRWIKLWRK